MKIFCKELNKEFDDKQAMFAELKSNQDKIKAIKKAAIKYSDPVNFAYKSAEARKAEGDNQPVGIGSTIYAVINCCNWLDSHGDMHVNGIWDVSIKDQKNKLYYIINHELELGKVISYPDDTLAYVEDVTWGQLGTQYTGNTQALLFKSLLTDATNKDALGAIVGKKPIQNSVRMQYISMTLCIDDQSEDFAQEYANFYRYLAMMANKQDAIDAGYFWAITEAKIYKEGSAVLFGSNEATPILYSDPGSTSQKQEDESPMDISKSLELINSFKFIN